MALLAGGTGAIGSALVLPHSGPPSTTTGASRLTKVVRTDLTTGQRVQGTLGYGPTSTLSAPGGASPPMLAQAEAAVSTAAQKLDADQRTADDQTAVDQQAVDQARAQQNADRAVLVADQQKLEAAQLKQQADCAGAPAPPSSSCTADQQAVAAGQQTVQLDEARVAVDQASVGGAQATAHQKEDQAQAQVAADQVSAANAGAALQPLLPQAVHGGIYTDFTSPGRVVSQGHSLYSVDGHAVPLFYGARPLYRRLALGVSGPDVQQLEQNLMQLGFATGAGLAPDGSFTSADATAVRRWQAAIGAPQTGEVWLGDLVFLPGPARVAAVHPVPGTPVQPGQAILDLTSPTRVVTVQLNPSLAYAVAQGQLATIDLPDGRTRVPGLVADVATVAQQVQGPGAQTQNGAPQSTIAVTIAPTDSSQLPDLDSAPVSVEVTTRSAKNVLAVPVNALLALEGGGYAVEVPNGRDRGTHLVPVRTGIFDSSLVEVSGPGLAAGMSVMVPT